MTGAGILLRGVVVVALIAGVLATIGRDVSASLLEPSLWAGFAGAQVCALGALLFTGWTVLLLNGPPVRYPQAIGAVALSIAFFLFLPSRLSDGLKPLYLTATTGQPVARGLAAVLAERFLDLCVVGCLIVAAIVLAASGSEGALVTAAIAFWSAVAVGTVGIVLILNAPDFFDRIIAVLPFAGLRGLLKSLVVAVRETVAPHRLMLALCTATATWLISVGLFQVFLGLAGSIELNAVQVLVVFVLATAGLAFAVTPGGIGTFEAGFVAGMSFYGYGFEEALLLAVGVRLANMSVPIGIVAVMIIRGNVDVTDLIARLRRRSEKEVF